VALSGDIALIGADYDTVGANSSQGSAYVFTRSGTSWTQQAHLIASDGAAGDDFGTSVALSGDMVLVGAFWDDVGANADQGSAYVFTYSGSTWTQHAHLIASDGAAGDRFGTSVALSGDTALISAPADDVGANVDQGSAYVFTHSGSTWTQQAQLTATDGAAGYNFGQASVALSGDTALVGVPRKGSAYVFARSGTSWSQQAQLTASDGTGFKFFGYMVALSGATALIGAPADDVGANVYQGSAYFYQLYQTFADVPPDQWAYAMINRLYAAGITSGCGTNPLVYCPDSPVTRAQMAVFLERGMRGAAYTPPAGTGAVFADVSLSTWGVNWIEKLYSDGITGGCLPSPLSYCPANPVTRAQMAKFLLLAKHGASYSPPAAAGIFADVPTSYWAAGWIEQLYTEGITGGCSLSPLSYCPENSVTRAQMAKFLVLTFNLP
jgi:hypothetical protein